MRTATRAGWQAGAALLASLGCVGAPAALEVELARDAVISPDARVYEAGGRSLPIDARFVRVCVFPDSRHPVSHRWTVRTPGGREAQLVAHVELANGRTVRFASPWSTESGCLCVQPRWGGPLEAAVERVRVVASTPIGVERIVWQASPE